MSNTFPVFQSVRVNAVLPLNGKKHRISTLGPRLDNTPEAGVTAITALMEQVERRVR